MVAFIGQWLPTFFVSISPERSEIEISTPLRFNFLMGLGGLSFHGAFPPSLDESALFCSTRIRVSPSQVFATVTFTVLQASICQATL